ncbi:MAG TPA: hypothetical protein VFA75_04980 [Nevskia sp.]|nr:hypothetical protein [Nevskia sp.]
MTVTPLHGWGLAALMLFICWRLYRRYRSHIGPQKVRPLRMSLRVTVFSVFAVLILASPIGLLGREIVAMAIALGAMLGWISLSQTHFENRDGRRWYTPNIYIGLGVTALLAARVIYRLAVIYPQLRSGAAPAGAQGPLGPFGGSQSLPTLAVFGVVIGYYAVYYGGVLLRSRQMAAEAPAAPAG